ncbi:hypothetical protein Tco_0320050 [Tanacetum coccineum]
MITAGTHGIVVILCDIMLQEVEYVDSQKGFPRSWCDSGCSSHMTGNKAYLSDYEDFNGGLSIKIHIDSNVADLLTKGIDVTRFNFLVDEEMLHEDKIGKVRLSEEKRRYKGEGYVSKQGKKSVKTSKGEPSVHKDLAFDDLDDDAIDYMETEDAQDEGRTCLVEKVDSYKVYDRQDEGTVDQNEGKNATQTAPTTTSTPTPTIFGDDETIAQVLITMSPNKQKEKEKGAEIRN